MREMMTLPYPLSELENFSSVSTKYMVREKDKLREDQTKYWWAYPQTSSIDLENSDESIRKCLDLLFTFWYQNFI